MTALLPAQGYLSIAPGNPAYNGITGINMPSGPEYHSVSGLYQVGSPPNIVFGNNATRFSQYQATYWYYNIQGYSFASKAVHFKHGQSEKQHILAFEGFEETAGPIDEGDFTINEDSGDGSSGTTGLWGIAPFFGRVASEISNFKYAAMHLSNRIGSGIGDVYLSVGSSIVNVEDIDFTNPIAEAYVRRDDGSVITYVDDCINNTRVESSYDANFDADAGDVPLVENLESAVPRKFVGKSFLTTFPIEGESFFYDAYGKYTGFYKSAEAFQARIAADNADGLQTVISNPTVMPKRFSRNLSFGGASYYQLADSWMPNASSHRIKG